MRHEVNHMTEIKSCPKFLNEIIVADEDYVLGDATVRS